MLIKKWDKLPTNMQNNVVKPYYEYLKSKTASLIFKRFFDILASLLILILLSPVYIVIALIVKLTSNGPVFYMQKRITQYGRTFKMFKFRSMVTNADKIGSLVTVGNDSRITPAGKVLRKLRLDELPQALNVLIGDMTFVGTRPEVQKYVDGYTDEMFATLLLPAGITSPASIAYKDEEKLLDAAQNPDEVYLTLVLPEKMKYNLSYIKGFSFWGDIKEMFRTVSAVTK